MRRRFSHSASGSTWTIAAGMDGKWSFLPRLVGCRSCLLPYLAFGPCHVCCALFGHQFWSCSRVYDGRRWTFVLRPLVVAAAESLSLYPFVSDAKPEIPQTLSRGSPVLSRPGCAITLFPCWYSPLSSSVLACTYILNVQWPTQRDLSVT